ncbi:uncharacterized protein LOC127734113 isoform X5 [Mytilus californianus]|uniref:uncharacterized protein LOC127734113 isoform X5 n=1 Tax=Mytilus californianus TaxID=6549 RepID=UPI0022474C06|nr:uncharacterized protein LOC127734113 isoform X5 [Mytilus californianus]
MEKPVCKSECNDNGDCSDDDANKGSDDAVNVVKSLKHTPEIHTALPNKINYICIGTMVSVVGIVLTVVVSVTMLVVISTDDKQNGFQLSNAILKISNQLDNLSIKMKSDSSTTDEPQTCENINTSYLYYVMQEENKRLKAELQKTKFRKDDKQNGFQLSNAILKMSNQLDSLSIKLKSDSSTDGPQTCENINTSYLYYVMQEENKRLKAELQKTKFRKEKIEEKKCYLQKSVYQPYNLVQTRWLQFPSKRNIVGYLFLLTTELDIDMIRTTINNDLIHFSATKVSLWFRKIPFF